MVEDKELHLNGTSKKFLGEFFTLKEKLLGHLEYSAKQDEKLDNIDKKIDMLIENLNIHKTYFRMIGAILLIVLTTIGAWAATHYG